MIFVGFLFGAFAYFFLRCIFGGVFTVQQNERAVVTSFGRAERLGNRTIRELPIAEHLSEEHQDRYDFPQVRVIGPGGPYWKWPWQKVHKVDVAIRTVNAAYDPEYPNANQGNTVLEAVTKDQLNIGVSGQIRFKPAEENLYAYLFGVKNPEAHIMGYFVSILRESIATFVAKDPSSIAPLASALEKNPELAEIVEMEPLEAEGISLNDLRKNLNDLNNNMDRECLSSSARYGIVLDASLITGIDPPQEIESALAAITTAHNEVSADISVAKAMADQKIEQSKRAVEIQTMRAQAEVQPLAQLSEQLVRLKQHGEDVLSAYLRNIRLELFSKAKRVFRSTDVGSAKGGA